MTDEKLGLDLARWMRDTEFTPPDASRSARQVATRLPETRQLGRRWWLPSSRHTQTHPTSSDQTIDYEPSPILATNGRSPTVIGRSSSMLSPAKAITAGAIVFAIGGVMLIAQPFQQQGAAPGAEGDAPPPAEFTTTFMMTSEVDPGVTETLANGVVRNASVAFRGTSIEASDPRFEGTYTWTITYDTYPDGVEFNTGVARITNDDGAWQQVPQQFFNWTDGRDTPSDIDRAEGETAQRVFIGEDGYEGLVAVAIETSEQAMLPRFRLDGYILDGELPPLPEPYVEE